MAITSANQLELLQTAEAALSIADTGALPNPKESKVSHEQSNR